jgi:hypothetical protein
MITRERHGRALDRLTVAHAGAESLSLSSQLRASSSGHLCTELHELR